MDGIGVGNFSGRNDARDIEVRVLAGRIADANRFVGKPNMEAFTVGSGIDCNGTDIHLLAGADDPQRDFTPVGDQDFLEHDVVLRLKVPARFG